MNARILRVDLRITVVTCAIVSSRFVDARDENADQTVAKSPEHQVLDRLIGTWGPSNNRFDAMRGQWAIGEAYLQIEKHFDDAHKVDTMTLLAWDQRKKVYRCWQFSRLDEGSPQQGEGTWDQKSNTLTFICQPDAVGNTLVIAYKIGGNDLTYTEGYADKAGTAHRDLLTCAWIKRKD